MVNLIMTESSINDSILNIKTFYGYLEHVIDSIDSNNYHEPTVNKISEMIKNYYEEINAGDNESLYEDDMVVHCDNTSDNTQNIGEFFDANESSESESDTSDEEEDESSSVSKSSQNSQTKQMIKKDQYLLNFIDGTMDNSKIELYKNQFYMNRLNSFVDQYNCY